MATTPSARAAGSPRVGILDGDPGFVAALAERLAAAGWSHQLVAATAAPEGLVSLRLTALVVDPLALGPSGWSYLETVPARIPHAGLVVCTGRSGVAERVKGLRLGADDWITKPCHPEEVVARLEAVVRRRERGEPGESDGPVRAGELLIYPDRFQTFAGHWRVDLTRREFQVLLLLAQHSGQVLQREHIYERVWGYAMAHGDRSVDVFVRKLRTKLERSSPRWRYIHTHFGIGYRFAAESDDAPEPAATAPAADLTPALA